MKTLKEKSIEESGSITHCRNYVKEIDMVEGQRRKVAFLSSYTMKGITECLKVKAFGHDLLLDVYEGEYNQWQQEIFGTFLYEYKPEIVFIVVDFFGIEDETFFGYSAEGFDMRQKINTRYEEIQKCIHILKSKISAKIVIANAVQMWPSLDGVLSRKRDTTFSSMIEEFNRTLFDSFKKDSQVFVFDMNEWVGYKGKKENWYGKFFYMADMKLSPHALPDFAEEMMSYVVPLFGKKKKCIVLDLDNTLWGGIIGEDGIDGIKLGPVTDGQPFYYFQKCILNFKNKGFLLAVCSRNNERDVLEVFDTHPHMVLKRADFVAMRINWEDKALNIQSIAQELNIGLDSIVFIDDDPTNTQSVKELLKDVDVITLPKDPTEYINTFLSYKGLSSLEYTEEDSRRTEMYQSDKERKKFESEAVDMESFLKGLGIVLTIKPIDEMSLVRSAQLTQKTNQFNVTTRRYTEEDIKKYMEFGHKIWTLEVSDRFGHHGIVGLCIVHDEADHWNIDTFLMSCRVLGRKIEHDFFRHILNSLNMIKPRKVRASYIPTQKNSQVKDFYKVFNFIKIESSITKDIWELDLATHNHAPYYFTIISNHI